MIDDSAANMHSLHQPYSGTAAATLHLFIRKRGCMIDESVTNKQLHQPYSGTAAATLHLCIRKRGCMIDESVTKPLHQP